MPTELPPGDVTEFDDSWYPKLPAKSAKALRGALRPLLKDQAESAVREFLETVDTVLAHFCQFERRKSRRPTSQTKLELKRMRQRIASLSAAIRRMSKEAVDEIDVAVWPGIGIPSDVAQTISRVGIELLDCDGGPVSHRGERASTYIRAPALIALHQMRLAIDSSLKIRRGSKNGAPRKLAWHHLSYGVARALVQHFDIKPSSTSGGRFERILSECLRVGLDVIGSKKVVAGDLRTYTRDAVRILNRTKPRQK
jgi:ElaB/YqjD/DUF883 family membrane-anchored ribosome-binding protein